MAPDSDTLGTRADKRGRVMTKSWLTCSDSDIASSRQQYNTMPVEGAAETNQSERRHSRVGVFIVLATAVLFYGGIALCIWKRLL